MIGNGCGHGKPLKVPTSKVMVQSNILITSSIKLHQCASLVVRNQVCDGWCHVRGSGLRGSALPI